MKQRRWQANSLIFGNGASLMEASSLVIEALVARSSLKADGKIAHVGIYQPSCGGGDRIGGHGATMTKNAVGVGALHAAARRSSIESSSVGALSIGRR